MYSQDNPVNFFLSHYIADYSTKFVPALDQRLLLSKLAKVLDILVDGRQRRHPPDPSFHHKSNPTLRVSRFPHFQSDLVHLRDEPCLEIPLEK